MSTLPNKYVNISQSILGLSAFLIESINMNDTVSSLWERVHKDSRVRTFDRYSEALSLLFAGGILILDNGILNLSNNQFT